MVNLAEIVLGKEKARKLRGEDVSSEETPTLERIEQLTELQRTRPDALSDVERDAIQNREQMLSDLETEVTKGYAHSPKAKSLAKKVLDLESKLAKGIFSTFKSFAEESKKQREMEARVQPRPIQVAQRIEPERAIVDPYDRLPEQTPETEVGSVFAPLFGGDVDEREQGQSVFEKLTGQQVEDKKANILARERLNKIINELQQLKKVV